jgi:hypothetical protein
MSISAPTPAGDGIAHGPRFEDHKPHGWDGRAPWTYPVHGTDVSKYQGSIDWPAVRASGISFAFIKATEGGDRLDDRFAENWHAAKAAGIPRGAYHFFYFCRPAHEQAVHDALDHAREMERRGLRRGDMRDRAGSLDPSQLTPLGWLGELRDLFPQSVCETVQAHAIDNLGMRELLSDPAVLDALAPNKDLLKSLIAFKGAADPAMREKSERADAFPIPCTPKQFGRFIREEADHWSKILKETNIRFV